MSEEHEVRKERKTYSPGAMDWDPRNYIPPLRGGSLALAHTALILRYVSEAIISLDTTREIVSFNRGAEKIFGYRAEEVVGRKVEMLLPKRFRAEHREHVEAFGRSAETSRTMGGRQEVTGLRKSGEEFPAEASITRTDGPQGSLLTVLLRDVTAQRRVQQMLQDQARALQKDVDLRKAFMATISHELRTPLNAILGYNQLLEEEIGGSVHGRCKDYVKNSGHAAHVLLQLIDEILTYCRLDAEREQVRAEWIEPKKVFEESRTIIEPLARQKGLEYRAEITDIPDRIHTDPGKLRHILLNLLGNAVKFTESGEVSLSFRREGPRLVFRVADTGPGIREDELLHLFEPFWRSDEARAQRPAGTGLGLAISRGYAELLQGEIDVGSTVGVGSVFTLRLPLLATSTTH